jgi:hypothetical protein
MEMVAGGTATRYGHALPVLMLAKASIAWLHGLFDLGILVTRKCSLISLNLAEKVFKSVRGK